MIKRLLGIAKLEEIMRRFHSDTQNHWGHTQNLYKLYETHQKEMTRLREEVNSKTDKLLYFMNDLIEKMESAEDRDIREVVPREAKVLPVQEDFPDTDVVVLQIMHQNAAFDTQNAVTTARIYDNLPFPITKRGLRKKLISLTKHGVLMTFKRANERYWHISTGKLASVKEVISSKRAKEQAKD